MDVKKQRLLFHYPYNNYIILQIIQSAAQAPKLLLQIFGLKFLNVSICFLDFFVLLNSNLSVT